MQIDINHGKNFLNFDGTTLEYKNYQEQVHNVQISDLPLFTFTRATLMGPGEISVNVNGERKDVIPYRSADVTKINKFIGTVNTIISNYRNDHEGPTDPNGITEIDGVPFSNSGFLVRQYLPIVKGVISQNEVVYILLRGAFKEFLIVTDKTLYIIKQGYMTGHMLGSGAFTLPLSSITNVSIDFHLMTGYFTVSTGGVQNTHKEYWSNDKSLDPAKSPNTISLNAAVKPDFDKAVRLINTKLIPDANRPIIQVAEQSATKGDDIPDQIRKFKQLLDDGIITSEEFNAKKQELLGL